MTKTEITIEIDKAKLPGYSDEFLAACWHAAQWNPAPHGDHAAGKLAEHIAREIIRRWLRSAPPELRHHQGRDYYCAELTRLASYQPGDGPAGSPDRDTGKWVPRAAGNDSQGGEPRDGAR
jgi:hypothetical protein